MLFDAQGIGKKILLRTKQQMICVHPAFQRTYRAYLSIIQYIPDLFKVVSQ